MTYDKNEIRAGAVILVATAVLVGLVFAVGDFSRFFTGHYYVDAVFDTVQGLPASAPVIYRGLTIGNVEAQHGDHIDGRRVVLVRMRIQEGTDILAESTAKITQVGFLNRPFVAILDPLTERPMQPLPKVEDSLSDQIPRIRGDGLADFTEIAVKTQTLMDEIMKNTLPKVNDTIAAVKDLVSSEEVQQQSREAIRDFHALAAKFREIGEEVDALIEDSTPRVQNTLSNIEVASADARELVKTSGTTVEKVSASIDKVRPDVERAIAAVRKEAEQLSKRIDSVQTRLERLLDHTDTTVVHVSDIVDDTTAIMRTGRAVLEENRHEIHEILANLERTSKHLESLMRQLDDSPSRLIFDRSVRMRPLEDTVQIPEPATPEQRQ